MHWNKEVEIAKSIDELMTSQSIAGRKDLSDHDMLDAMIASALKKLLASVHFRKKVSVEEQRAQKYNRFLRGRQIAHMNHEHFRATGAYDAVEGLSDLFHICLRNDDVQDFDTKWDQSLLGTSESLHESVLEGLYRTKLQGSDQLQTVLALHNQEWNRDKVAPNYQQLRTMVRQKKKIRRLGHAIWEPEVKDLRWEHWSRVKNGETTAQKEKWENVFSGKQMDSVRKEIPVVSSMVRHLETDKRLGGQRDTRPLPHQVLEGHDWRRDTLTKFRQQRRKPLRCKGRIPCRYRKLYNPSCNCWHPPVCLNYKSESGCT